MWSGIQTSCRRACYADSQLREGHCHFAPSVAAVPSMTGTTVMERGAAAQLGAVEACGGGFPGFTVVLAASEALGPCTCSRVWGTAGVGDILTVSRSATAASGDTDCVVHLLLAPLPSPPMVLVTLQRCRSANDNGCNAADSTSSPPTLPPDWVSSVHRGARRSFSAALPAEPPPTHASRTVCSMPCPSTMPWRSTV